MPVRIQEGYSLEVLIPKGKVRLLPPLPHHPAPSRPLTALFLAPPVGPQVFCRLFLNPCCSGASALNTKHPLPLSPSPTLGDCSHHGLPSTLTLAHTSVKCHSQRAFSPFHPFPALLLGACSSTQTQHTIGLLSLVVTLRARLSRSSQPLVISQTLASSQLLSSSSETHTSARDAWRPGELHDRGPFSFSLVSVCVCVTK